jgi:uncharacterized protein (DUF488 family)
MKQIFTIGHSNRSWNEFVFILLKNCITMVIDVRRFPGSGRYPHFNKANMIKLLTDKNIQYVHIEKLGGRRDKTDLANYGNSCWQNKSFQAYANYMKNQSFKEGIDEILSVAKHNTIAIMCAEALPWRCHRRLISDYLIMLGLEVYDVLNKGT